MFISSKEIVTIDNKEFIRLFDAMQVIAPTTTNASRWFQQHQELFSPETFVYSDERFPGKKKRIWITLPEGFQALVEACIKAPRLKVPEGVEDRIAPFLIHFPLREVQTECGKGIVNCQLSIVNSSPVDDDVDIEFDDSETERPRKVIGRSPQMTIAEEQTDSHPQQNAVVQQLSPTKGIYQEPQEKMYGLTVEPVDTPTPPEAGGDEREEWVEFLQQTLSNLVARYYAKMCWLKRAQTEAPVEIQAAFTDLCNTLHDTLIGNVIADILKYPPEGSSEFTRRVEPVETTDRNGLMAVKAGLLVRDEVPFVKLLDHVEEYLSEGYEISFEADKEGVLCRVLSGSIGVNAVALNWKEAFAKAVRQIPFSGHESKSDVSNSLYTSNADGNVELANGFDTQATQPKDMGGIK